MHIDIEEVRHFARKIKQIVHDFDSKLLSRCGFDYWSCTLPSVQSVVDQVNALTLGDYGIERLIEWHIEEGVCVSEALELQCDAICFTDNEVRRSFEELCSGGAYGGVPRDYRAPEPARHSHSFSFPDMTGETFPSHGIPLAEEPLGRDPYQLAIQFGDVNPYSFARQSYAWKQLSGTLGEMAHDIYLVANNIEGSGSRDAFTYAASTGIRRWAKSLDALGDEAANVSKRMDSFADTYGYVYAELDHIADDIDKAKAAATPEYPYSPEPYRQQADTILTTYYNPCLPEADTRTIEFPVPQRALRGDYDPTPRHTPSTPSYSGVFGSSPHISANPHLSTPSPSRPMIVPPSGTGDVTPPHGMTPAPTDPNRVTPPNPGNTGGIPPTSPSPSTPPAPGGAGGGVSPAPYQPPVGTIPGVGNTGGLGRSPSQGGHDTGGQRSGNNTIIIGGVAPGGSGGGKGSGSGGGKGPGTAPKPGSALKPGLGSGTTTPTTPPGSIGRAPGMAPHAPGFGGKGAVGITPTLPPTHTGTPTTPGMTPAPSAHQPGAGRPMVPIVPTPPAAPTTSDNPKQKRHRAPRSAENTENILQQPTNLPRGIIRHPDDPLYGTGR